MWIWAFGQAVRVTISPLCSTATRSGFSSSTLPPPHKGDGDARVSKLRGWPFRWMVRGVDIGIQASRWVGFGAFGVVLALFRVRGGVASLVSGVDSEV